MAVLRYSHGYVAPVRGFRRFSVRNTRCFSWALPTKSTPSRPRNFAKYSAATASFRAPRSKGTSGIRRAATKRSMARTNAALIGSIRADETKGCPRYLRK